jgi:uncharacterized protein (TIGR02145 family)
MSINRSVFAILLAATIFFGCKKKEELPSVTTTAISNITATSASSGGTITNEGSSGVISRGVCWSPVSTPTISDNKSTGGVGISFSSNLTNLNAITVYYVRAYATNSVGTSYGEEIPFTTLGQTPASINADATNITATDATLNGTINANYLSTTVTFEYGTTTSYGYTGTPSQSPVSGNIVTNVSINITALAPSTTYHYRLKAVNSLGTTYSNDLIFTTLGLIPTVSTIAAISITSSGAALNGSVNANYLSTVVTFEYGTNTSYGSTVSAIQNPITGSVNTNVSSSIVGLNQVTTYHFRVKAVNSLGTSYGNDLTFTTTATPSITDIDGNKYYIVTIGNQVWMAENLKVTKYNDGTIIPNVISTTTWTGLTTGAYCDYNNIPSNAVTYGRLYNWYVVDNNAATKAVSNGGKNVCPIGWHMPSNEEWKTLTTYLGGEAVAGSKLKEAGTSHWQSPNTGATNETGFTGLPSGYRLGYGTFTEFGINGYWWSSSENSASAGYNRLINANTLVMNTGAFTKRTGQNVRCLRD